MILFVKDYYDKLTNADENGLIILHKETIAGNLSSVEVLPAAEADRNAKTNIGKTALDLARQLNWEHIIPVLENSI